MFYRFYDEGLAQASFLVGCNRTRRAVVIDPRRDAAIYVEAARQTGTTIVAAIETHVHADFVSGARELAAIGVPVFTGPGADLHYEHHEGRDNEEVRVGDATLTLLHTPGHTFEHIAILASAPDEPRRLFTGDLLFVGGVGRPDLLGDAQTRSLAGLLYDSLRRIAALDLEVEVHPGHGAGSLCGTGIGQEPSSTIGRERDQNPLLHDLPRAAFVNAVLADLPATPPYFARMKRLNLGPELLGLTAGAPAVPSIRPAAAAALSADGAGVIDLRTSAEFAAGHPDGAVSLPYGSKVGYWAGWVLPPDLPLLILSGEPAQARDAAMQLRRVGLDRIEGTIDGGFAAWQAASLPTASFDQMRTEDLLGRRDLYVVDVRSAQEWQAGHLADTVNIPVGEIPVRLAELPAGRTIATICEGGYRSSLAASLLAREGFPVVNIADGMAAYRGLPEATR
jgi:hydroxyacylglutathione hydrolase